jgi:hypothetical protein
LRRRQRYSDDVALRRQMELLLSLDFLRRPALPESRNLLALPSLPSGCKREGCGREPHSPLEPLRHERGENATRSF